MNTAFLTLVLATFPLAASAAGTPPAKASTAAAQSAQWVTLGTNSGPVALAGRNQPANLLIADGQTILVDAGDGACEEVLRYNVMLDDVHAVFLSHLHFDHTGGLFAFLGRRYQVSVTSELTIYGPPGTKRTVDGLIAAMQPMHDLEGGGTRSAPGDNIKVVELTDGAKAALGGVRVTAAVNSHYVLSDEKGEGNRSLSYRFDAPGRSITYSGDTGPSTNLEKLATGTDLLVTEIMDAEELLDRLSNGPHKLNVLVAPDAKFALRNHFTRQHLSPEEVGLMAQRSGAKALLLTHDGLADESWEKARARIAKNYPGPITFARDMQAY